jgi:tryptophan-rich sensory protein
MRQAAVFLAFLLAVFAAAGVGGYFTGPAVRDWYPALAKPSWTPPAWVFGPVWTILYLMIATAGFLAWRKAGLRGAKWTFVLFAAQLVLNAAWSWVSFGLRQPAWAFAEIVVLWATILATTIALLRVTRPAGLLFVPYLLWTTYAAALNFAIWRMNHPGTLQAAAAPSL